MKDRLLWARIDDTGASGDGAEAVVPWWSVTKTAIAATALRLAAAGHLDLDAGLPEGPFSLRRLLRHEARLPDYGTFPPYAAAVARGLDPWPPEELLARTAALPAPTAWTYSNVGYLLARRALERSQGAPLGTLLAEWLLAPLGLARPRLAETRADMEAAALPSPGYHPGWVYHGCLLGPGRGHFQAGTASTQHRRLGDVGDHVQSATCDRSLVTGRATRPGRAERAHRDPEISIRGGKPQRRFAAAT
jgi:CubicO group peptidase (beta-lactamase class C family)